MTDAAEVRAHVRLVGRVQGVGFRYSCTDQAQRRGLTGWVRNLDSGAVEAVFQGPRAVVDDMLAWCGAGPSGSYVRQLRVAWDEPLEQLAEFAILRSEADYGG